MHRPICATVLVVLSGAAFAPAAVASTANPAAAGAPSSQFQRHGPAQRVSSVPPRHVRTRAARALRAAGRSREARRALRRATAHAALAGSGYGFSIRSPQAGSCLFAFSGNLVLRDMSIAPPIVYAQDATSQYVYWASFIYDYSTGATTWNAPSYQQAIATRTTPAHFAGAQSARVSGGGAQAIGMNVYWWSATQGWLVGAAWDLPMWVGQHSGSTFTGGTNNRC
jgi:hypothetical protein